MVEIPGRVRRALLLRSFTIQGSWNYETLIGTGFAFTLLPALRWVHGDDRRALAAAIERHAGVFNSHPYLATVAVGAVARLEAEGMDPTVLERFKSALRGSLGSLGDRLVWTAWRPATLLLGIVLLLAGAAWWLAVAAVLVPYNVLHVGLRVWGVNAGIDSGLEVGPILRGAPLQQIATRAADAGAFLSGVAVVLTLSLARGAPTGVAWIVAGAAAGLLLGLRARTAGSWALITLWLSGIVLGLIR